MKVSDLIKKLEEFDKDTDVKLHVYVYSFSNDINEDLYIEDKKIQILDGEYEGVENSVIVNVDLRL